MPPPLPPLLLSLLVLSLSHANPTNLLVVREACHLHDPSVMTTVREHFHDFMVLSYNETCGTEWAESVGLVAMATLAAGGDVVAVGERDALDAGLCAALEGAASLLGRVLPPPCVIWRAIGVAVCELACRLRWRRAALWQSSQSAPHPACRAALHAAQRALADAQLLVRHVAMPHNITREDQVLITCGIDSEATLEMLRDARLPHDITILYLIHPRDLNYHADNIQLFIPKAITQRELILLDSYKYYLSDNYSDVSSNETVSAFTRLFVVQKPIITDNRPVMVQVQSAVLRYNSQQHDGEDSTVTIFNVYERTRAAGVLTVTSSRRLAAGEQWASNVSVSNWSLAAGGVEAGGGVGWDWRVVWASAAAALLALSLALGAHAVAAARRRRRERRGVLLAAADFSFPADETRRVGEGMESMLSCWLEGLHSLGAPAAKPDAPSAPSSRTSVSRLAPDRRPRYRGDPVYLKHLPAEPDLELKSRAVDVLLTMQSLRHDNINPFLGMLVSRGMRPALAWEWGGRGSLEDVLRADDIRLDWAFRLSLLTDCVRALRYLHGSPLRAHGRLTSRCCAVDARWVLRVGDAGVAPLCRAQGLPAPLRPARDLLWTAPELLRQGPGAQGTPAGDIFSFAIIMQEVIVRGEPYCMLSLTPQEIIVKLKRPPPLVRPSVSLGAAPPEAVGVMRRCWHEAPEQRPAAAALLDTFRQLHRGRKTNIVDSMFEMLEKYSNNLEELIKERTEQLDMEKKKTEQLLNRMLPKSVAERLLMGSRVEPEEFEDVTLYFSDIVGFTALAARSTPVQVVDLLNDLYTRFDAAIEQYPVYKVETIGDAYMVAGGLPTRSTQHAAHVATMALHLLSVAGAFRPRHVPSWPLHVRIGLHSGPVCAAVVGLTMPRYCLFGDTVNTASRMESTGAAWRIQVSAATAARLEAAGGFRLRARGAVLVKGKGAMHTHWLLGKDGFQRALPAPPPLPGEEALVETEAEDNSSSPAASTPEPQPPPYERSSSCDKLEWRRSGALSADSSPPRAPYSRYRRLPPAAPAPPLRRQWSLDAPSTPPPAPLVPVPRAPRDLPYRTRPTLSP